MLQQTECSRDSSKDPSMPSMQRGRGACIAESTGRRPRRSARRRTITPKETTPFDLDIGPCLSRRHEGGGKKGRGNLCKRLFLIFLCPFLEFISYFLFLRGPAAQGEEGSVGKRFRVCSDAA